MSGVDRIVNFNYPKRQNVYSCVNFIRHTTGVFGVGSRGTLRTRVLRAGSLFAAATEFDDSC